MNATALKALGWKPCFEHQLSVSETRETTVRVGAHFGSQVLCISARDEWRVSTLLVQSCGEVNDVSPSSGVGQVEIKGFVPQVEPGAVCDEDIVLEPGMPADRET